MRYSHRQTVRASSGRRQTARQPSTAACSRASRRGVQKACKQLGFKRPLLWISFNVLSSEGLIGALDEQLVVYHCTDEITAMSGTSPFAGAIERRLLAKSDLVFTSSRQLLADDTQVREDFDLLLGMVMERVG